MAVHIHFINPNTDDQTIKMATELFLTAAGKRLAEIQM